MNWYFFNASYCIYVVCNRKINSKVNGIVSHIFFFLKKSCSNFLPWALSDDIGSILVSCMAIKEWGRVVIVKGLIILVRRNNAKGGQGM